MLRYLLDTNVVIYAIKNRPPIAAAKIQSVARSDGDFFRNLGELVYGVERSAQPERNLADIESLGTRLEIMPFDQVAASHFGRIRAELYCVGAPIGPYDMMIAGQARASGLVLVSNNVKEFEKVPGLMLENWVR